MTSTAVPVAALRARSGYGVSLGLALVSAAAFGLSGSLARALLDLGWSPAAVVTVRVGGAFLVLLGPALAVLRRTGLPRGRQAVRLVAYGVVAVALAQLCFFSAVQYLPVGVALLLEYLAPVLLIGYHWLRTRRRPASGVLAGAVVALAGLALVLDVRSVGAVHPLGLLWGLGAALCLSAYFLLTEERGTDRPIHPVLLTVGGTGIGGGLLVAAAAAGLLPLVARTGETRLAGSETPWWLPALALVLVSAVLAYLTGIVAVRRLGSSAASFVGLTEVLFAVAFAAILLGQHPGAAQLAGGVLVLIGITLVQRPPRRRGRSTLAR